MVLKVYRIRDVVGGPAACSNWTAKAICKHQWYRPPNVRTVCSVSHVYKQQVNYSHTRNMSTQPTVQMYLLQQLIWHDDTVIHSEPCRQFKFRVFILQDDGQPLT